MIKYTIPRKVPKSTPLETAADLATLVPTLKTYRSETANVHAKLEVEDEMTLEASGDEGHSSEDDADDNRAACKKSKTQPIDPEDLRVTDRIQDLHSEHKCAEHQRWCLVNANGEHETLNNQFLYEWGVAWNAGVEGVDVKTPPNRLTFNARPIPHTPGPRNRTENVSASQPVPVIIKTISGMTLWTPTLLALLLAAAPPATVLHSTTKQM
ncbi:hypothetical protein BKA62DRAFT_772525 [Auriculariales sp. MPI-PUGE-AT-0066]|nr:hypothetical protein BKA62DRAFT_772525 [Auriculariales sp. MPI-PUGE-AT-0066]